MPTRQMLRTYYVYDQGLKDRDYLGGIPVKLVDNHLIVAMTYQQAEYWIGLGTIGPIPLSDVTNPARRTLLHQLSGGRIPIEPGGAPSHVVRNAWQNPNTMADKLAQGFHPAFGTTVTTEEQRKRAKSGRPQYTEGGGKG
jgi:hypothetical protein